MSSWYHKHPKRVTASDIMEMPLVLLEDYPPEPTRFGGMQILTVQQEGKERKRYRLMMTEQEVSTAVEKYVMEGRFAVVPTIEGYVEVVSVGQKHSEKDEFKAEGKK